jgi:hypothetical protein
VYPYNYLSLLIKINTCSLKYLSTSLRGRLPIDFSNLFIGTSNPQSNKEARINNPNYKLIAEIGALYGWYNPWRLSNGGKSDELWHFEYWGPA